jgi:hypothetical protein
VAGNLGDSWISNGKRRWDLFVKRDWDFGDAAGGVSTKFHPRLTTSKTSASFVWPQVCEFTTYGTRRKP